MWYRWAMNGRSWAKHEAKLALRNQRGQIDRAERVLARRSMELRQDELRVLELAKAERTQENVAEV
jgi:hypothetical protein